MTAVGNRPARARTRSTKPELAAGSEPYVAALVDFGLTISEARAYVTLLELQSARAARIATHARIPRTRIYDVLRSLEDAGFCRAEGNKVVSYRAVSPDVSLPRWVEQRARRRELEQERDEELATRLIRELPRARAETIEAEVETLVGHMRSSAALPRLGEAATKTLDIMQAPPFFQPRAAWNVVEADAIARGVRVRIINTEEGLRETARVQQALALGAELRVSPSIPMKLIVSDKTEAAIAPVDISSGESSAISVLVRQPEIVKTLQSLFESEWARAEPVAKDGLSASARRR
jgi:sugar-specific transcriptional regulator TrmB